MALKIASLVNAFKAPRDTLGPLDPDAAATLITAASDIALIIDADGVIRDIAFNSERLALDLDGSETWIGQLWVDVVTIDSRPKVEAMLRPSPTSGPPR